MSCSLLVTISLKLLSYLAGATNPCVLGLMRITAWSLMHSDSSNSSIPISSGVLVSTKSRVKIFVQTPIKLFKYCVHPSDFRARAAGAEAQKCLPALSYK